MITEATEAALILLQQRYEQVAQVNFTTHKCNVIWPAKPDNIFWIDDLWNTDKLYPKDAKSLRKFHNIHYISGNIEKKGSLCYKFRQRRDGKHYEWMQIEVIKNTWYSPNNIDVLVFIKSIEDSYAKEYNARKKAENLARTDELTGFFNRLAFDKFKSSCVFNTLGLVYIDLNRLKAVNDTQGHDAGDEYIRQCCKKMTRCFKDFNKYRIGGDEFVLVARNIPAERFKCYTDKFNELMIGDATSIPVCSFGCSWTSKGNMNIEELIQNAETKMYLQKEANYLKFNVDRRSHIDRRKSLS